MQKLIIAMALNAISVLSVLTLADEPSDDDKDLADKLVADYTANRAEFSKYAAVALIERFVEDHETPRRSGFTGDWFVLSIDKKENLQRLDFAEAVGRGTDVSARRQGQTLLSVERKHYQFLDGRKWGELKVENDEDLTKPLKTSIPRFDPWDLPLGSSSTLIKRHTLQSPIGQRERILLTPEKLVKFSKTPDRYFLTYLNSSKYNVYLQFAFDRRRNNLPVESRMLIGAKDADDSGATVSVLKTQWAELTSEKGWVPVEVSVRSTRGPVRKPAEEIEEIVTFFWVFDNDVPRRIFDEKEYVPTIELRDYIIDVQSRSSSLRMPPKRN